LFFLPGISVVEYSDPWALPVAARLERVKNGRPRVAYVYDAPDNSTFRYRVYNMLQALEARPEIGASFFTGAELELVAGIIDDLDVLVVVRFRYSQGLNHLITLARERGKRVLFDTDDLVYDVDYTHLILNTLDQALEPPTWDSWFAYIGRMGATLKLCDEAITTNPFLAERISAFSGKPAHVIPNFMNREQLAVSEAIYRVKRAQRFARSPQLHVGYFSGTPTHNLDLALAADAIARLLERRPEVVLRIVGYMELRGRLQTVKSRIEYIPFQDFMNLQRLVGEVELNLMPLQNNVFTRCKSELKYFEAGIVGTISVASAVGTYADSIRDGENGFLASDFEWDDKLEASLAQLGHYAEMAERAHADCQARYTWQQQVDKIADVLFPR
jgi:glycosyltransferase involved in cell wall biosynthesis